MRISDWSSDVCSSDLARPHAYDIEILVPFYGHFRTVSVFVFRLFCRRHRREAEWSFPRVGTTWKSSRGKPSHRLSSLSGQDHCSLSYGGFRKSNRGELCFHLNKGGEREDAPKESEDHTFTHQS